MTSFCLPNSAIGKFGWTTIGGIHLPYILRFGVKYLAERIVELSILKDFRSKLQKDVFRLINITSFRMIEDETVLFNEINKDHCDSQYGSEDFQPDDLLFHISDVVFMHEFLQTCFNKLTNKNSLDCGKCGFARFSNGIVVPFTKFNGEKLVPLACFEGEIEFLKQKADYLWGHDLAYMKFCIQVQELRSEELCLESMAVIPLREILQLLPADNYVKDYWPHSETTSKLLVPSWLSGKLKSPQEYSKMLQKQQSVLAEIREQQRLIGILSPSIR